MKLKGKGLWAWRLWELDRALTIAHEMDITHILYKVAQGALPGKSEFYIDNAEVIAQRIRDAGFTPIAWSFTTLADPVFATQSVLQAFADGFEGFVFNAEDATNHRRAEAVAVGNSLRNANVDLEHLYLCSYPTPITHHPEIPYNEMGPYCQGGLMPMVYGTYLQPPEVVVDQWTYAQEWQWMRQQDLDLPIHPVMGPHYDEFGNDLMSQDEFRNWLDHVQPYAPSFISVFSASMIRPIYYAPLRAFELGPGGGGPTRQVWINVFGGGVIFGAAGQDGSQREALPYGTELIARGEPFIVDGKAWIHVQSEDEVGWMRQDSLSDAPPPPYPELEPPPTPPPGHLLTVWTTLDLNMRSDPVVRPETLTGCTLNQARLRILQNTDEAAEWIGKVGKWLRVKLEPQGPEAWVAAWYVTATNPNPPDGEPTLRVVVHSPTLGWLRIRKAPTTSSAEIARLDDGTVIWALEPEDEVRRKVGELGEWLRVRTPQGEDGYAAAWYLRLYSPPTPTLDVVVESPDLGFLRIREGPGTGFPTVTEVDHGTTLEALEPEAEVRRKVGKEDEWLRVRTPQNEDGHAAAWYLKLPIPPTTEAKYVLVESPNEGLNIYEEPNDTADDVWWVPHTTPLESLEEPETTAQKVGQPGQWLHVRTPSRQEGYVAAWRLRLPEAPDNRQPVEDQMLPLGISAWLYGMHAARITSDTPQHREKIRQLFEEQGNRGWILFTEDIQTNPNLPFNPESRERFWNWATNGYGVVVRLNNSYYPGGSLPTSEHYDAFAETCARWVELYLLHDDEPAHRYTWIIQIANEPNNPVEHPQSNGHYLEHITPELYAKAFNKVYAAIKSVLPQALVAPGAVDPYNSQPLPLLGNRRYRPLDYFQAMLEGISTLDAIMLHAYTHGPSVEAVTSLHTFADPFLNDHYFDFQTYRQFAERIPARWKELPIIIGESNHICRPPNAPNCDDPNHQGWINANIGWVRAVYEEINRWNNTPYFQQIRGLLLYRWLDDQWRLYDKEQILNDFRQSMAHDYRWRA